MKMNHDVSFPCNICGKMFGYPKDVKRHENTVHSHLKRKRGRPKMPKIEGETSPCIKCEYVGKSKLYLKSHSLRTHAATSAVKCVENSMAIRGT